MVLSLYTNAAEDRDAVSAQLRAMFAAVIPATGTRGSEVLEWNLDPIVDVDPNAGEIYRKIHFGYTDGVSNPLINAVDLPPLRRNQLPYVPVWQFVTRDGAMTTYNLPSPQQFGQNGTFSAFRILKQNVPVFEAFSAPKAEMKLHKSCSPASSAGDGAMAVPSCSSQMHSAPFCPMTRCKVSNTAPTLSANPARFPPTPGTPTSEVARWSSPAATR